MKHFAFENFVNGNLPEATNVTMKGPWRFRLAERAIKAGVAWNEGAMSAWLDANYGSDVRDLDYPRPAAHTLRRWVRSLQGSTVRPTACALIEESTARPTSLDRVLDAIVREGAARFFLSEGATLKETCAFVDACVARLNRGRPPQPYRSSMETLRRQLASVSRELPSRAPKR